MSKYFKKYCILGQFPPEKCEHSLIHQLSVTSGVRPHVHTVECSIFPLQTFAKTDCFILIHSNRHILWKIYYVQSPVLNSKMSSDSISKSELHMRQKASSISFTIFVFPYFQISHGSKQGKAFILLVPIFLGEKSCRQFVVENKASIRQCKSLILQTGG